MYQQNERGKSADRPARRAYPVSTRERILAAVDAGMPRAKAAAHFNVSLATIKRYLKQRRDTGTLAPKSAIGRPPAIATARDPAQHAALQAQLAAHPEATLADFCRWWTEHQGRQVSIATMSRTIARLGWTRRQRRWQPRVGAPPAAPENGAGY